MAKSPNSKAGAKGSMGVATDKLAELAGNPLARSMLAAGLVAAAAALTTNQKVRQSAKKAGREALEGAEAAADNASKIGAAIVSAATDAVRRLMVTPTGTGAARPAKRAATAKRSTAKRSGRKPAARKAAASAAATKATRGKTRVKSSTRATKAKAAAPKRRVAAKKPARKTKAAAAKTATKAKSAAAPKTAAKRPRATKARKAKAPRRTGARRAKPAAS
jgi:histone H1/5